MEDKKLTNRQKREQEYYAEYSRRHDIKEITFDPVLRKESRPWCSYWFVNETMLKEFDQGKRKLLDFGCGNGRSSVRYAKIGYNVWSFDISSENITIGKRLAKKYNFNNKISFDVQAAEHLNYSQDQFDVIVGVDILHHIEIRMAVKECYRILKKGGVAVFREHIEVPIFEKIRNVWIVKVFFPNDKSLDNHITDDEKKLTDADINDIKEIFPDITIHRFVFFSRLNRFIRKVNHRWPSVLEKMDYFIFNHFPFMRKFGGGIVIILKK